jgi:hypothetical protein
MSMENNNRDRSAIFEKEMSANAYSKVSARDCGLARFSEAFLCPAHSPPFYGLD